MMQTQSMDSSQTFTNHSEQNYISLSQIEEQIYQITQDLYNQQLEFQQKANQSHHDFTLQQHGLTHEINKIQSQIKLYDAQLSQPEQTFNEHQEIQNLKEMFQKLSSQKSELEAKLHAIQLNYSSEVEQLNGLIYQQEVLSKSVHYEMGVTPELKQNLHELSLKSNKVSHEIYQINQQIQLHKKKLHVQKENPQSFKLESNIKKLQQEVKDTYKTQESLQGNYENLQQKVQLTQQKNQKLSQEKVHLLNQRQQQVTSALQINDRNIKNLFEKKHRLEIQEQEQKHYLESERGKWENKIKQLQNKLEHEQHRQEKLKQQYLEAREKGDQDADELDCIILDLSTRNAKLRQGFSFK